jgi:hypothetical protein
MSFPPIKILLPDVFVRHQADLFDLVEVIVANFSWIAVGTTNEVSRT